MNKLIRNRTADRTLLNTRWLTLILGIIAIGAATKALATNSTQLLAEELAQEKQYKSAAIEYRRLALTSDPENERSAYYWGAAYMYYLAENHDLAQKMLDYAEESEDYAEYETILLRLDCAIAEHHFSEASFYTESLLSSTNKSITKIAEARGIKLALMEHKNDKAAGRSKELNNPQVNTAVEAYTSGSDKSPGLGGVLGMIPGLGYAYSGEYANALRSLILNGVFIYGMVETADDGNWGIFSVITFFEITWYSGSIYGGIDSAQRYNQRRLQACIQVIDDHSGYKPNLKKLPVLTLKYTF